MLLALFTAEDAGILIAGIAVIGSAVTSYFGWKTKQATTKVETAIGTPNGKGDVVVMNEKQLTKMQVIEDKLDFISDMVLKHISTPGAHGGHHAPDPYADWDPAARR